MKKILTLITKPIEAAPRSFARIALLKSSEVALIQDGVYNDPEKIKNVLTDDKSFESIRALDVDVKARRVTTGFGLLSYSDLVDAIERCDKVITI